MNWLSGRPRNFVPRVIGPIRNVKVFVTGASGFVGREVVRQLRREQNEVRILARSHSSRSVQGLQSEFQVGVHAGDVTRLDSLRGALKDIDAVIHLVGIISEAGQSTFENVHVRGTQNVVKAVQGAGVKRLVHMSALGTRPGAASRYHRTKWEAEEEVRRSGLDFTIFRPSLICGPNDHFVNLFAKLCRFSPVLPVIGDGHTRFEPVAVEAVASAFAKSLTARAAIGETFDLCGPQALSFNQMLDLMLEVTGRRRLKVHIPLAIARWQARVLEWVFPVLLNRAAPLNRDQITMLQEDNVGNGGKATQLFGLVQTPFKEEIASYL